MKPDFLRLSGTASMTYTNVTTGETFALRSEPMEYSSEKILYASLCTKPPISSQISYYESVPFASKRYKSSGTVYDEIHYYYKVYSPVQGDTTSYVDLLSIAGRQINMYILVSDRGKPNVRSLPLVKDKDRTRIIADTVLNNQPYRQVYCQATNPTVFFTIDRGVVAFQRTGAWWFQTGFRP